MYITNDPAKPLLYPFKRVEQQGPKISISCLKVTQLTLGSNLGLSLTHVYLAVLCVTLIFLPTSQVESPCVMVGRETWVQGEVPSPCRLSFPPMARVVQGPVSCSHLLLQADSTRELAR